jgi:hypothetical protein
VLVIVERTEAGIVLACVTQFYTGLGDEVDDIDFGFDLIKGGHNMSNQLSGIEL